jgi:hypothetical protein
MKVISVLGWVVVMVRRTKVVVVNLDVLRTSNNKRSLWFMKKKNYGCEKACFMQCRLFPNLIVFSKCVSKNSMRNSGLLDKRIRVFCHCGGRHFSDPTIGICTIKMSVSWQ